jgi:hypothetical protein
MFMGYNWQKNVTIAGSTGWIETLIVFFFVQKRGHLETSHGFIFLYGI